MFWSRHHQTTAFFAQKWPKKDIFWPETVFLGREWSVVGLPTLFRGCWTQKKVFCKVLEQVIDCFGAAITKKPHFLHQNGQKNATFCPKQCFWGLSGQL